ncbi:MAG: MBL fold metallo-hydrolase, partial [Acidimicrobiia bacterium]|nr:MBL fold metallo-hydrolase [Acidimicrobiia bacterium]
NLGFVSAYFVYRGGSAVLVDTGVAGSEDAISEVLGDIGLGWDVVSDIVLTHRHGDHIGSIVPVASLAPDATVHIGAGDIDALPELPGGPASALSDGDVVFDLEVIETPGHTPGHISVLDTSAGILIAGDALNNNSGQIAGSEPQYTSDETAATASVLKLAGFDYEIILCGHGEPILENGSAEVAALAKTLS